MPRAVALQVRPMPRHHRQASSRCLPNLLGTDCRPRILTTSHRVCRVPLHCKCGQCRATIAKLQAGVWKVVQIDDHHLRRRVALGIVAVLLP
eukprot:scaffold36515_cov27-Tisochrysis_lutea.AAC.2